MSIYSDASLIFYPSGYKENKVYCFKPTDGSGDLTFTRASTATRVNESGLIEEVASGVPRIDYTGGGCGKLLLEPQRTNLINNSANVGAGFTRPNITVVLNNATAPNGLVEADKFYPTTSGTYRWFYQAVTTSASNTISVFAKADGKDILYISQGSGPDVFFDLSSGLVTYESSGWVGSIEDFGDGWYRCIAVKSSSVNFAAYGVADSSGYSSFVTASGTDGILVWGMQCESSATYPTSYIPTSGTAVTRLADSAKKTGISSLIGQTEGTLYWEGSTVDAVSTDIFAVYSDNPLASFVSAYIDSSKFLRLLIRAGGTLVVNSFSAVQASNTNFKIAFTYKSGASKLYYNGALIVTSTTSLTFIDSFTTLELQRGFFAGKASLQTQAAMIFKTPLSDAECIALTTL